MAPFTSKIPVPIPDFVPRPNPTSAYLRMNRSVLVHAAPEYDGWISSAVLMLGVYSSDVDTFWHG
jgi:hypothetical protein